MTLEVWYWLFMALWIFVGIYENRATPWQGWVGGRVLFFILFLIIGLRLFGSPIKG